jgi:hypothetical protein
MLLIRNSLGCFVLIFIFSSLLGENKVLQRPPSLPVNIPPPPNFSSSNSKNGRFVLTSAEYYSQDAKPYLYKRLIKIDSSTGEAWVLQSLTTSRGEKRKWVPLEN